MDSHNESYWLIFWDRPYLPSIQPPKPLSAKNPSVSGTPAFHHDPSTLFCTMYDEKESSGSQLYKKAPCPKEFSTNRNEWNPVEVWVAFSLQGLFIYKGHPDAKGGSNHHPFLKVAQRLNLLLQQHQGVLIA